MSNLSKEPLAPGADYRGYGPAPLGEAVKRFLKDAGLTTRRKDATIYAAWDTAVGPDLVQIARAASFRKGTLTVEVPSSSHLQELKGFTGEGFRAQANQILERPLIRRVKYRLRRRS